MLNSNNSYYKIKSICFCLLSPKKLVRLFILREVKPSPDSIRIKRLTVDNLFPPLRQNDASSRVSNTQYYRGNHSYSYSSSSRNLIKGLYYRPYLNRSLTHPHGDHSYAHPMDDVDNSQWKFHSPDTEHRPAKSFHFLDRTGHFVEH